jgi:hypothetical protein
VLVELTGTQKQQDSKSNIRYALNSINFKGLVTLWILIIHLNSAYQCIFLKICCYLPPLARPLWQVQRKIKVKIRSISPDLDTTESSICQNSEFDNPFLLFLHNLSIEEGPIAKILEHFKASMLPHKWSGWTPKNLWWCLPRCIGIFSNLPKQAWSSDLHFIAICNISWGVHHWCTCIGHRFFKCTLLLDLRPYSTQPLRLGISNTTWGYI